MKLFVHILKWLITAYVLLSVFMFESIIGLPVLFFTAVLMLLRTKSPSVFMGNFLLLSYLFSLLYPFSWLLSALLCALVYMVAQGLQTMRWLSVFTELLAVLLLVVSIAIVAQPVLSVAMVIWTFCQFAVAAYIVRRWRRGESQ